MEWSSGLKMAHRPDTVGGRGGGAYDYRYEGHILGSIHVMGTSRFYGSANCVILGFRLANSYPKH